MDNKTYHKEILLCWCLKTGKDKWITLGSYLNEFIYQVLPKLEIVTTFPRYISAIGEEEKPQWLDVRNSSQFNKIEWSEETSIFEANRHGIVGNQDREKKKNISMNIG